MKISSKIFFNKPVRLLHPETGHSDSVKSVILKGVNEIEVKNDLISVTHYINDKFNILTFKIDDLESINEFEDE